MPSLVLIGQQTNEKQRGAQCAPLPAYMVPKDPSLNRVKARIYQFICLPLPVRRCLVPTPSTKGGGGGGFEPILHDLENGRLYKLQLWQAIRTIYERYKTSRVNDLSLVMFP